MSDTARMTVIQTLPALEAGGVERGTLEVAAELVRRGHRSIVISGGGRMVAELTAEGSEHIELPIGRKSPLTLALVPRLRELLSGRGANLLHTRSRLPAWISYLAWKGMDPGTRPRFITSVHGPYTVNRYSRVMTAGERVIAISDFIREYILANYPHVLPGRIKVIHRGVSPARFPYGFRPSPVWLQTWHAQYPVLAGRSLITLPARLTRWKGHEDFIRVIGDLVRRGENVHGLVVGAPHPRKMAYARELENGVAAAGLGDRISFTGHRTDLREIMSVSAVVLSLSNVPEAFGRTVLEALSLGVPVVAYDHGGAGEVLDAVFPRGRVPPAQAAAVSRRVSEFLRQRPDVPAQNPFTLQRMLDATLDLYQGLCGETRPGAGR